MHSQQLAELGAVVRIWSTAGPLLVGGLVSFALGRLVVWCFSRGLDSADLHWTEVARRLVSLKVGVTLTTLLGVALSLALWSGGAFSVLPRSLTSALNIYGVGPLLGALLATHPLLERIRRTHGRPARRWRDRLALYGPNIAVALPLIVAMDLLDATAAWHEQVIGLALVTLSFAFLLGGWIPAAALLGRARRVNPAEFYGSQDLGARAIWVTEWDIANAFAYPWLRWIMVPRRTLTLLTPEEMRGVLLHEAEHLREPRSLSVMRLLPYLLGYVMLVMAMLGTSWSWLAAACLAPCALLALVLVRRRAQAAELHSDAAGGSESAVAYATALEKLYEWSFLPATATKRARHASLYDRMTAAGVAPSWPRPAPPATPPRWSLALVGASSALLVLGYVAWRRQQSEGAAFASSDALAVWLLGGGDAPFLLRRSESAWLDGRREEALGWATTATACRDAGADEAHTSVALAEYMGRVELAEAGRAQFEAALAARGEAGADAERAAASSRVAWRFASLGDQRLERGEHVAARADYEVAACAAPNFAWPLARVSIAWLHAGDVGRARAALERAEKLHQPKNEPFDPRGQLEFAREAYTNYTRSAR